MRVLSFALTLLTLPAISVAQAPDVPSTPPPQPSASATAGHQAAALVQQGFKELAREVFPSVVTVRAFVRDKGQVEDKALAKKASQPDVAGWGSKDGNTDYPGFRLLSAGSGFVVDPSGEVLTCYHVLQAKDGSLPDLVDIETQDGSRILTEIAGAEPTVNLAILRCVVFPNGHKQELHALRFGDSDALECGQWTIGFGDPPGPEKFFAVGSFIARPTRDCYQDYLSSFYLQTSMLVHREAYGGPLVNLDGEVIGILSPRSPTPGAINVEPRSAIEFALPSKIVSGLYQSIRKTHSLQSPWLGFSVMSRAEIATTRGVEAFNAMTKPRNGILIENVFQPSPAADTGIKPDDFLVSFDSYRVFTPVDFQRYLYLSGIGKKVKLEIFHNGETTFKELTILRRPPEAVPR